MKRFKETKTKAHENPPLKANSFKFSRVSIPILFIGSCAGVESKLPLGGSPSDAIAAESCALTKPAFDSALTTIAKPPYSQATSGNCATGTPSFPGAEGFGSCATGGRSSSSRVFIVTKTTPSTTNPYTEPGTLQYALAQTGPRYIVFETSGVIDGIQEIRNPDVTIAGQTSPGGITLRGVLCDNQVYEPTYICRNVVMRHLRTRPASTSGRPGGRLDDALRIDGGQNIMIDHLSIANGDDETVQMSRASNVTIQNSLLSELAVNTHPWGEGMLINYSSVEHPLDNLSFHHNVWNRLGSRLPEISCEENGDDGPSN